MLVVLVILGIICFSTLIRTHRVVSRSLELLFLAWLAQHDAGDAL